MFFVACNGCIYLVKNQGSPNSLNTQYHPPVFAVFLYDDSNGLGGVKTQVFVFSKFFFEKLLLSKKVKIGYGFRNANFGFVTDCHGYYGFRI